MSQNFVRKTKADEGVGKSLGLLLWPKLKLFGLSQKYGRSRAILSTNVRIRPFPNYSLSYFLSFLSPYFWSRHILSFHPSNTNMINRLFFLSQIKSTEISNWIMNKNHLDSTRLNSTHSKYGSNNGIPCTILGRCS